MARNLTGLEERKRELVARSDLWRREFVSDVADVEAATLWIPRTLHYARMAAPILAMVLPLAGLAFGSRKRAAAVAPSRKNLLGKVMAGYHLARRVKPIWDAFHHSRAPR